MKLIAGLGNIGDNYLFTRHNAGFMVVDKLAADYNLIFKPENKLKSLMTKFRYNDEDVLVIKPVTYMNLSGEAVRAVKDYYKVDLNNILIIYDDLSLDLGKIRFRANGSDGGHNGIKSVINHLGSDNFDRLKIGIGPQPPIPSEKFVLQNFAQNDLEQLKETIKLSLKAVEYYLTNGISKTQNQFN